MSYKLSHTAQEVDELLGKVKGGVCLPVVEIADVSAITAEESAKLTACIGNPCTIKTSMEEVSFSAVCSYYAQANLHSFSGFAGEGIVMFASEDGITWSFRGQ